MTNDIKVLLQMQSGFLQLESTLNQKQVKTCVQVNTITAVIY
jgi:hypothetical protein